MVTEDGVNLDAAEEAALGLENAEEKDSKGQADCAVNAVLDGGEDGHENTDEENEDFEGRNEPELIDSVGGRDEITDSMDNDGGEGGVWDIVENGRQSIDGQQNHDSGDNTGEGSAHTGLRLNSGTTERACSGVSTKEGAQHVGNTDGHHFLGWVDGVVVDTTE